jgi:hypothetical protein
MSRGVARPRLRLTAGLLLGLAALTALPVAAGVQSALGWSFDADLEGGLPAGAEVFDGVWAVPAQADAPSPPNALCQTGSAQFPALALSDKSFADVVITARFKPIAGQEDQAAGLIFRIQDRDNYYILRANALEDNVNFYKYSDGRRSLMQESRAAVPSGQWQERVEVVRGTFRGFLNGQPVAQASDDGYAQGRVGLWTKADSVTCFDEVQAQAL